MVNSSSDVFAGFVVTALVVLLFAMALFLFAILGTSIGAFVGWIIHISPLRWFVEKGFEAFGINAKGLLVHIGATLGFVTGFLRGLVEIKHVKE